MGLPTKIGKVYVKEQAGSWGTAEESFVATDLISCKPFIPPFVQEALRSEVFRGGWHEVPIQAGSRMGADFVIEHTLQGWSTSTPAGNPTETPDGLLLKSVLGSADSIGYKAALAAAGNGPNLIAYENGDLSTDWSGMAVLVPVVAAPSGRQIAWAKTIDTASTPDDITPWNELDGAATDSGVSYGSRTIWLSTEQPTPFTVQAYLGQADAAVEYRDCVCVSAKFTLIAGKLVPVAYGVKAGYWRINGSWTVASYADNYPEMPPLLGANGTRVAGPGAIPQVDIELTADMQPITNLGSVDAFQKWLCVGRDVTVEMTHLSTGGDDGYEQYLDTPGSTSADGLQIDFNTTPGRAGSFFMPSPMASEIAVDSDGSGLLVRKRRYKPRPTALETAGSNAANSGARIALL